MVIILILNESLIKNIALQLKNLQGPILEEICEYRPEEQAVVFYRLNIVGEQIIIKYIKVTRSTIKKRSTRIHIHFPVLKDLITEIANKQRRIIRLADK